MSKATKLISPTSIVTDLIGRIERIENDMYDECNFQRWDLEPPSLSNDVIQCATSTASVDQVISGLGPMTMMKTLQSLLADSASANHSLLNKLWNPLSAELMKSMIRLLSISTSVQELPEHATGMSTPSGNARVKTPASKPVSKAKRTKPALQKIDSAVPTNLVEQIKPNAVIFEHLKHVRCKEQGCKQCLRIWQSLKFSECAKLECHRKNKKCHESGWYRHVLPSTWSRMRKDHDSGLLSSATEIFPKAIRQRNNSISSVESSSTIVSDSSKKRAVDDVEFDETSMESTSNGPPFSGLSLHSPGPSKLVRRN